MNGTFTGSLLIPFTVFSQSRPAGPSPENAPPCRSRGPRFRQCGSSQLVLGSQIPGPNPHRSPATLCHGSFSGFLPAQRVSPGNQPAGSSPPVPGHGEDDTARNQPGSLPPGRGRIPYPLQRAGVGTSLVDLWQDVVPTEAPPVLPEPSHPPFPLSVPFGIPSFRTFSFVQRRIASRRFPIFSHKKYVMSSPLFQVRAGNQLSRDLNFPALPRSFAGSPPGSGSHRRGRSPRSRRRRNRPRTPRRSCRAYARRRPPC